MNPMPLIVPRMEIPTQSVPQWEQLPQECQQELIQAFAEILLHLPQVQALEEKMSDERQQ